MSKFLSNPDIHLIYESNDQDAKSAIVRNNAKVALIEATESRQFDVKHCLSLCEDIRRQTPDCKLLIMCSEQDEQSVQKVVAAKGNKQIDDFVFYDVTIDYLASKLISI